MSYGSTINFCAGNFPPQNCFFIQSQIQKIRNTEPWLQWSTENSIIYPSLPKTCSNTPGMNLSICLMDPKWIFVLEITPPQIAFSCNLESKNMKKRTLTAMKHCKLYSISNSIKEFLQYSWTEPSIVSYGSTINFCAGNFTPQNYFFMQSRIQRYEIDNSDCNEALKTL